MSDIGDYQGRLVDMAAFQGVFPVNKEQLLVQELATHRDGGSLLAGIEKLAQKVLITLLTVKGSKKYAPKDGCMFIADARMGGWRTVADVTQSFLLARSEIRDQIVLEETEDDPPDERYGGMTLAGVTLAGGNVTVRIELTSQAGDKYVFLTPIKVAIR